MNYKLNKTLYGVDTNGRTKVWQIYVEEGAEGFLIRHGKYGGKMTEKFTKTSGKNIGKANETTPHEQAILEAHSRVAKQMDKGYNEQLEFAGQQENPMLAHDYRKQGHRIDYQHELGVFVQPKLDGVRCLISFTDGNITFKSRGGKFYNVPEHLKRELEPIFEKNQNLVLDGELYIHGMYLQDIISCVKKPNKDTKNLELHIFDIASLDSIGWWQRRSNLNIIFGVFDDMKYIKQVPDYPVANFETVKAYHDTFVSEGYEGVMIRQGFGEYQYNHRSPWLQKYKEFLDEEFEIVDVKEDKDGLGVPVCKLPDGNTFDPTYKASHSDRKRLLEEKDKVIGKMATIKFQAYTKDNVPQFPVTVSIRDYE